MIIETDVLPTKMRENFEESLENSLKIRGVNIQRKISKKEEVLIKKFRDENLTSVQFEKLIQSFGEKTVILNCFNGNRFEYEGFRAGLKSIEDDYAKARRGENPRYFSAEEGKVIHDRIVGDHAPAHTTHLNSGLGSDAGFVGRNNRGYVAMLFADGYLQKIDGRCAQDLVFQLYGIQISEMEAIQIADDLNRDRRLYEAKALQGDIGDSKTVKHAISIITNEGKKKGFNYEKTNTMGIEVRKTCAKLDNELGKIIGTAKIKGDSPELNTKTARVFANILNGTSQDTDIVLSLVMKILRKTR